MKSMLEVVSLPGVRERVFHNVYDKEEMMLFLKRSYLPEYFYNLKNIMKNEIKLFL